jgi:catechol 2,3-dioxygenase-like lactoylglutathione lyase family enzyme
MKPNVRLDHCVVHVSDWPRSNAFYRDVLGTELVRAGAGWSYRFGDHQLNLHRPGVDAAPVADIPVPPGGTSLLRVAWSHQHRETAPSAPRRRSGDGSG